jgi:hypothetical protein
MKPEGDQLATDYPLMFTFRDVISGNGFLAGVTITGRAIMFREDDAWWMYGVRPGAIAETGPTPQQTFCHFRERYKTVLFDIADEHDTFEKFKAEVERFYSQPDPEEERRWSQAVKFIRSGEIVIEPPFTDLPKESPETRPTQIGIDRLDRETRFAPTDNVQDLFVQAA